MAEAAQITAVKLQIPDEAADLGFDDTAIAALLDSGLSQSRTILAVLRGLSAKATSVATSITENNSSRSVDFFNNLRQLVAVWEQAVKDEDLAAGTVAKANARVYTAVRV